MAIETNPTTLGRLVTKPHYDVLYRSAILADSGGTPGGAQTVPGDKTFSGIATLSGGKRVGMASTSTTPYTITDTDGVEFLLVTTGATDMTMTLPTAADNTGRTITIRKVDSGAGKVTVDGEGAETIDGNLTVGIWYQYNQLTLVSTGTSWLIHGSGLGPLILIPEASRPNGWLITGSTTRGAWTDVTQLVPYAPNGRVGYWIIVACGFAGDGAADLASVYFRKNGSTAAEGTLHTYGIDYYSVNSPAGVSAFGISRMSVLCDSAGIFEYYLSSASGSCAAGILYLSVEGYYMGG